MKNKIIFLSVLISLIVISCGCGIQEESITERSSHVKEKYFIEPNRSLMYVGETEDFSLETLLLLFGQNSSQVKTWKISGEAGNISQTGLFQARKPGFCTIEAQITTKYASLEIEVQNGLLKEIFDCLDAYSLYNSCLPQELLAISDVTALEQTILEKYGSIEGFVSCINDRYTRYSRYEEDNTKERLDPKSFGGIGIYVQKDVDNHVFILGIIPDSPAEKANLQAGDVIVEVDNVSVKDLSLQAVVEKIKGEIGTSVKLKISRDEIVFEIKIERQEVNPKNVYSKVLNNNIGYIRIMTFGFDTPSDLMKVINDFPATVNSYIIDLRNNGGGYLESALNVLDLFIPEGKNLLYIKDRNNDLRYFSSHAGNKISLPMVVLVNKYTASAAEIMAAGLRDHNIAFLIGEKTFGKGTVQRRIELINNSYLYVTLYEFLSPLKEEINKIGVSPKVCVSMDKQVFLSEKDLQLNAAISALEECRSNINAQSFQKKWLDFEKNNFPSLPSNLIDEIEFI